MPRFRCRKCQRTFSSAHNDPCFGQRKRHVNLLLWALLTSAVSLRRSSRLLRINRKTTARKLLFLGGLARLELERSLAGLSKVSVIEFDDMETFEHSKCKPLSITFAVESGTRRILGFEVSQMPASGLLAQTARRRYGPRRDLRSIGRTSLLKRLKAHLASDILIKSDMNPHYPPLIRRIFPMAEHKVYRGRRGCVVGQGELKRGGFDPLFSLNHTAAMIRANVNRLFRKTWCTTKKREALTAHLALYAEFHNRNLLKS